MIDEAAVKTLVGQIVRVKTTFPPHVREPVYVATVTPWDPGAYLFGLVGQRTSRYYRVVLTLAEIESLTAEKAEE